MARGRQDFSYKLNTLESVVVSAEDSAEDARWQQAEEVVRLLGTHSTREIAAKWTNGRTGKPYNQSHVMFVKQVWERWGDYFNNHDPKCPDWTSAYYTVQQSSDELISPDVRKQKWSDDHEARAPKTERTAERLVDNLLKAPPEVRTTVFRGLSRAPANERVELVAEVLNDDPDALASAAFGRGDLELETALGRVYSRIEGERERSADERERVHTQLTEDEQRVRKIKTEMRHGNYGQAERIFEAMDDPSLAYPVFRDHKAHLEQIIEWLDAHLSNRAPDHIPEEWGA